MYTHMQKGTRHLNCTRQLQNNINIMKLKHAVCFLFWGGWRLGDIWRGGGGGGGEGGVGG